MPYLMCYNENGVAYDARGRDDGRQTSRRRTPPVHGDEHAPHAETAYWWVGSGDGVIGAAVARGMAERVLFFSISVHADGERQRGASGPM